MNKYLLKLYISGDNPKSRRAISNLLTICESELENQYEVEIIDIIDDPERAERDKIAVTPTLIKQLPQPLQRVIGDMSNTEKVLLGLDLSSKA